MSNKELYKNTFSQIHASQDRITEVIKMKDNTKKRKIYGKKLLVIAACAACLMSAGVVANAATDGELGRTVIGWFISSDGTQTAIEGNVSYDENGNKVTEAELEDGGSITIKENSNGSEMEVEVGGDYDGEITYSYSIDGEGNETEESLYVIEDSEKSSDNDTSTDVKTEDAE